MLDRRHQLRQIFDAGVAAADPYRAVCEAHDYIEQAPHLIVAVGKAAGQMARAAMDIYSGVRTIIVTNYENAEAVPGAEVFAAGHPVPDENGAVAARAVIDALHSAGGPVLALISGGGSALLPAPAGALGLQDKSAVNEFLLGAGLDIRSMNLVRQQLSDLKGGGMLRAAAPQPVTALILSDVVDDDLAVIASGPTVHPIGTAADAAGLLRNAGLWDRVPEKVRTHLTEAPVPGDLPLARNVLVGSNGQSVEAMAAAVPNAKVIASPVEGDVADAARFICDQAGPGVTLWGGETTVVLRGDGAGGRNQELALRIALEADRRGWQDWACLQAGSDGRDGPTDAAGGVVDEGTLSRIRTAGGEVSALLANNDSYKALNMAGDLLITGATGTNVADLGVLIRG